MALDCSVARRFLSRFSEQGVMHVIVTCTLANHGGADSLLHPPGKGRYRESRCTEATGRDALIQIEANRVVTHARPVYSMHNFGLAFDVVPLDEGNPVWKVSDPVWQRVGRRRKECGLECAGDCKRFREYAHLQYRGGSVSQKSGRGRDRRRHSLPYPVVRIPLKSATHST